MKDKEEYYNCADPGEVSDASYAGVDAVDRKVHGIALALSQTQPRFWQSASFGSAMNSTFIRTHIGDRCENT